MLCINGKAESVVPLALLVWASKAPAVEQELVVKNKGFPKQFHVSNVVLVLFPTMQLLLLVVLAQKAGSVQRKVPRNVLPVQRVVTTIIRLKRCPAIVHGVLSIRFPRQNMHLNPRPVFPVPMANLLRPTVQSLKMPVKCSTYKWCLLRAMVQK